MNQADGERLQVILAHAGVASRRAAERLMLEGRVRVNGELAREPGMRADPRRDQIEVDGKPLLLGETRGHQYVALNKPLGVVSTAQDTEGRTTVVEMVNSGDRLYPVGRLDIDSEGLVLLTDDGDLTYRLTQARYEVEKEYHALVDGWVAQGEAAALVEGIDLEDGPARAVRAEVLHATPDGSWVRVVLVEGRQREVRRMFQALGRSVARLRRERIGTLTLGDLRPGEHRALGSGEVAALRRLVRDDLPVGWQR